MSELILTRNKSSTTANTYFLTSLQDNANDMIVLISQSVPNSQVTTSGIISSKSKS
jgi:hypothetical protein